MIYDSTAQTPAALSCGDVRDLRAATGDFTRGQTVWVDLQSSVQRMKRGDERMQP